MNISPISYFKEPKYLNGFEGELKRSMRHHIRQPQIIEGRPDALRKFAATIMFKYTIMISLAIE